MDPVHITKGDENAQEKVDACLARLRQMMLDSDNAWDFDMQGTGTGTALATLIIAPKIQKPNPDKVLHREYVVNGPDETATEEAPEFGVLAVNGDIKQIDDPKYDPTKGDWAEAPGEFSIPAEEAKTFTYQGAKVEGGNVVMAESEAKPADPPAEK